MMDPMLPPALQSNVSWEQYYMLAHIEFLEAQVAKLRNSLIARSLHSAWNRSSTMVI